MNAYPISPMNPTLAPSVSYTESANRDDDNGRHQLIDSLEYQTAWRPESDACDGMTARLERHAHYDRRKRRWRRFVCDSDTRGRIVLLRYVVDESGHSD